MGDKIACIFASGPVFDYGFVASAVDENAYIICADGGLEHCLKCSITPNVVIGDLDSYSGDVDENILIRYPVEKDDTDTALCIKHAMDKGYKNIKVFGALGGRFDHSFANLQLLLYCKQKGVNCTLIDKETVFVIHNENAELPIKKGKTVSIFSLSVKAYNVTLKGLKYPLEGATLSNSFPLGVSNLSVSDKIEISVEDGTLLVVVSH